MPEAAHDSLLGEPEVALVGRLTVVENACLATVVATIAANMAQGYLPPEVRLAWWPMSGATVMAVLLTSLSLCFLRSGMKKSAHWLGQALALLVALGAISALAAQAPPGHPRIATLLAADHPAWLWIFGRMSPQAAVAFALLGATIVFVRVHSRVLRRAADLLAFFSALMVLVLVAGYILAWLPLFGPAAAPRTAVGTLVCVLALTVVLFIRRAQYGCFSVLFGRGVGSRLVRRLGPILLILPFFRELFRARIIGWDRMPPNYATAIMASVVAAIAISLLVYIGWRINLMEAEIHGLTLRDPLTGLYNLRGFRLLAEQALLLAGRSNQPFSLIFLDVDNLKQINDALGHQAGSAFLVETAEILKNTFRETDALARIGGDEFAVAGQFSAEAAAEAAARLRHAASEQNARTDRDRDLSFSVGCVTSGPGERKPLMELLAQADEAMYRDKRRRKSLARGKSTRTAKDQSLFAAGRIEADAGTPREPEEKQA